MDEILLPLSSQSAEMSEIIKDCIDHRILVVNREIDESCVEDYVLYILKWNREDRDIPKDKRKPIYVYINSPGGDIWSGFALVDAILQSETKVIGLAMGLVASMAYYIYIACHERYAFRNTVLLQHDGVTTVSNTSSKAKDAMKFFDTMNDQIKDFVISQTKITEEFYSSIYEKEYYMYSSEAKDLGCVHHIIGVDCSINDVI